MIFVYVVHAVDLLNCIFSLFSRDQEIQVFDGGMWGLAFLGFDDCNSGIGEERGRD